MKLITSFLFLLLSIPTVWADDLDTYKATCKEIGFKPKTPAFGDCVLELRKRGQTGSPQVQQTSPSQVTSQAKSKESYEEQATEFFRKQEQEYQRRADEDYARRTAEYERQKTDYDARVAALEREKERQKGLKLMELGLRMGAGQSARDASMATAGMAPMPPSPPSNNSFRPMENYRITSPSGNSVNCRYDPNVRRAVCY